MITVTVRKLATRELAERMRQELVAAALYEEFDDDHVESTIGEDSVEDGPQHEHLKGNDDA